MIPEDATCTESHEDAASVKSALTKASAEVTEDMGAAGTQAHSGVRARGSFLSAQGDF